MFYRLMIDSVFYDKRAKVEASILYASGNNPRRKYQEGKY